jgi:hypothetical protein
MGSNPHRVKPSTIKLILITVVRSKNKYDRLGFRMICSRRASCLPMECCFKLSLCLDISFLCSIVIGSLDDQWYLAVRFKLIHAIRTRILWTARSLVMFIWILSPKRQKKQTNKKTNKKTCKFRDYDNLIKISSHYMLLCSSDLL